MNDPDIFDNELLMRRKPFRVFVMKERAGSHGGAFWREEFPLMVAWVFGREITL